jgi:hypothetical protein
MDMATKTKVHANRKVADSYFNLIEEFPLTSIKSQDQLDLEQAYPLGF